MKTNNALTLAYVGRHPADAARVLERLAPDMGAALLQALDPNARAALVGHLNASAAALCVQRLDGETGAVLLSALRPATALRILRVLPAHRADALLQGLGGRDRERLHQLLRRRADTVGAVMEPRVFYLPAEITVGDARRRIQQRRSEPGCEVFVADTAGRLVGALEVGALLKAPEHKPLRGLVDRAIPALHPDTPLPSVAGHPAWHNHRLLPVAERDGSLVGALAYANVVLAGGQRAPGLETAEALDAVMGLAGAYGLALGGLLAVLVGRLGEGHGERGHG